MGWGWLVVMLAMVSKWLTRSRPSECGNMEPEKDKSSCPCPGRGARSPSSHDQPLWKLVLLGVCADT